MIEVNAVDVNSKQVKALISKLDALQISLYPSESNHLDSIETLSASNVYVAGGFINQSLLGIGAIKLFYDDVVYAEVKRLYVDDDSRGKGIAQSIMRHLENHAMTHSVDLIRLETGIYQTAAVGLYKKLGYVTIPPFGQYGEDPYAVFMEKQLDATEMRG